MLTRLFCILILASALAPALGDLENLTDTENKDTDPQYLDSYPQYQDTDPQHQDTNPLYQDIAPLYNDTDPLLSDPEIDPCQRELEKVLQEIEDEYQAERLSRTQEVFFVIITLKSFFTIFRDPC